MENSTQVILVDKEDHELGTMDKLEAHQKGALHRAVSVVLFNENGEMLLQQRALSKYHEPGKWSNTGCTHPLPGETNKQAALRCLQTELGLQTDIYQIDGFIYRSELDNQLIEHELDYVFAGICNDVPAPNPEEVMNYRYTGMRTLAKDMLKHPENYTPWSQLIIGRLIMLNANISQKKDHV